MARSAIKKRKVAVFDIDGTIFRSSLLIELVETLVAAGVFPEEARRESAPAYRDWLDRRDSYEKYIGAVIRTFDRHIRGVKRKKFAELMNEVAEFHRDRVYRYTRDLVGDLKKKGYYLLAISHSPKYAVERFGKQLGFNKTYGRILAVDGRDRFTGITEHVTLIMDKAKILRRAVEKENLTLKGSVGVGDTESDINFLKLVDRPICFNPNGELYREARRRKWQGVVERKDVVYVLPRRPKKL